MLEAGHVAGCITWVIPENAIIAQGAAYITEHIPNISNNTSQATLNSTWAEGTFMPGVLSCIYHCSVAEPITWGWWLRHVFPREGLQHSLSLQSLAALYVSHQPWKCAATTLPGLNMPEVHPLCSALLSPSPTRRTLLYFPWSPHSTLIW